MLNSTNQQQQQTQSRIRINYQIKASQVRLIDTDGANLGVVSLQEALRQAKDKELDLVEINGKSNPVVAKIIDYGKFKYEEKKKLQAMKKNQQVSELKEIVIRPNTGENDLLHKIQQAKEFLADGHKVKFSVRFRGREISHPEIGQDKLRWCFQQLENEIVPEPQISLEGKVMWSIVMPKKN